MTIIDRHHGMSRLALAEARDVPPKLRPSTVHGIGCEEERLRELAPILSAMADSENGAYDPSGRFSYHVERPRDGRPEDEAGCDERAASVDLGCRRKMLVWCTRMVDYFDIDRSVVAVAAYYQDRYLGTDKGEASRNDRPVFRVVSVAALYIAIKLRVPDQRNATPMDFAKLCQGAVSGQEIRDMELSILFALGWNVNPPIPVEYARGYLHLIFDLGKTPSPLPDRTYMDDDSLLGESLPSLSDRSAEEEVICKNLKDCVLELVHYQLDIALHDSSFFQVRSSLIATAALLNALEGAMNESPSFHRDMGVSSFCREGIALTLDIMASCKIATQEDLEDTRSALLSSALSAERTEDTKSAGDVRPASMSPSDPSTGSVSHARIVSPHVSSSPKSASKSWPPSEVNGEPLTPQSVLSKVFVNNFI